MIFILPGPRHSMVSTFYDDLFAFDMERKRWYKLGLKQLKLKSRNPKEKKTADSAEGDIEDEGEIDDDDDEGSVQNEIGSGKAQGELFGYIDEFGNVVYIDLDEGDAPVVQQLCDSLPVDDGESPTPVETISLLDNLQLVDKENDMMSKDCASAVADNLEGPTEDINTLESLETSCQPCARINPSILIRFVQNHI